MADLRPRRAPRHRRAGRPGRRRHRGEVSPAVTMTTMERVVALQRVPLFAEVPGRTLAALAQRATEVEVAAGEVVIEQGAVEDHLFAVVRGRLVARDGERMLRSPRRRRDGGRARGPRAGAALGVGHRPGADPAPADRQGACSTSCSPTIPSWPRGVITSLVRMIRSSRPREWPTAAEVGPRGRALVVGAVRAFGLVAALLGVVANAMFLEAYGAAVAAGHLHRHRRCRRAVSVAVARSAQRFDLVRIAVVVLGATAVLLLGAWVVTLGGGGRVGVRHPCSSCSRSSSSSASCSSAPRRGGSSTSPASRRGSPGSWPGSPWGRSSAACSLPRWSTCSGAPRACCSRRHSRRRPSPHSSW